MEGRASAVIVPASAVAGTADIPRVEYPIGFDDMRVAGNIYCQIRNGSFREWQQRHHRGGDFVVFSDYRYVTLREPIKLRFA
ncbi:DUF6402 family protein [Burkholderia lata]|uniref:DUF6402 family protein n=1 Tax=Burkholderia lata (strain ATCC 17760 / DSM 23089 / LMG 22485 / NCIMB 9086 / R18194 / 383) TaxID=482957 RepID=UPI003F68AC8A